MAEKRKLQSEIDKTLKRVDDGIEDFDDLLLKAEEAQTSAQKEKMEGELKRDIKKLQRLRDQIKVWLATPEVKDKPPLEEARKKIEKEMEKFKVCEKLFKIKAFSKEGLAQEKKLGPQEVEREKHRKWIRDSLERLSTEIDSHEAEIEKYKTSKKGRIKGADAESVAQLEQWASRHKWHVIKLEKVLRRLENDEVDMSLLDDLSESVDYYLESFQDPEYFHDDDMYGTLGLEETPEDQSFVLNRESDSLDGADDSSVETPTVTAGVTTAAVTAAVTVSHPLVSAASGDSIGSLSSSKKKSIVVSAPVVVPSTTRRLRQESSGEGDLALAAAASAPASKATPQARPTWSPAVSYAAAIKSTLPASQQDASPQLQPPPIQSQPQQAASQQQQPPATRSIENVWKSDKVEKSQQLPTQQPSQPPSVEQLSPPSQPIYQPTSTSVVSQLSQLSQPEVFQPDAALSLSMQQEQPPVSSPNLDLLLNIVDVAHKNLPDLKHRRHFRYYQPKSIWSNPPPSFPKYGLKDFATPQFFHKLDLDTLFFTFYHQQGTYQQYLAARELKRQNWRYHKKYLTWFQPQGGPKIVTDKFHRGAWVYFDSDAGWCSRLKHDFTFEFSYLEDEMPVPPPLEPQQQPLQQPLPTAATIHPSFGNPQGVAGAAAMNQATSLSSVMSQAAPLPSS